MIESILRRVSREGLTNVARPRHADDPRRPARGDAC